MSKQAIAKSPEQLTLPGMASRKDPDAGLTPDTRKLIATIKVSTSLSLSEVRIIRAKIRKIARSTKKLQTQYRWNDTASTLICAFSWTYSVEGYNYWSRIWNKISIASNPKETEWRAK